MDFSLVVVGGSFLGNSQRLQIDDLSAIETEQGRSKNSWAQRQHNQQLQFQPRTIGQDMYVHRSNDAAREQFSQILRAQM